LLDTDNHLTVKEAVEYLLKIEEKRKEKLFTPDTFCVGCARLGTDNVIKSGKASELMQQEFGPPPHCLIVPSTLHFMEEEFLA
jgi:diphthine synthase